MMQKIIGSAQLCYFGDRFKTSTWHPKTKAQLEWVATTWKAKANPIQLKSEVLARYAGTYQDRKVTLENSQLHYQRTGPKYKMIPVTETAFILEGLEDVHFEFVLKDGKAIEIVGVYADGSREPSKRTS